jgi:hypothetical protein
MSNCNGCVKSKETKSQVMKNQHVADDTRQANSSNRQGPWSKQIGCGTEQEEKWGAVHTGNGCHTFPGGSPPLGFERNDSCPQETI